MLAWDVEAFMLSLRIARRIVPPRHGRVVNVTDRLHLPASAAQPLRQEPLRNGAMRRHAAREHRLVQHHFVGMAGAGALPGLALGANTQEHHRPRHPVQDVGEVLRAHHRRLHVLPGDLTERGPDGRSGMRDRLRVAHGDRENQGLAILTNPAATDSLPDG